MLQVPLIITHDHDYPNNHDHDYQCLFRNHDHDDTKIIVKIIPIQRNHIHENVVVMIMNVTLLIHDNQNNHCHGIQ